MSKETISKKRIALITLLAWLSMVGIDFLIHGGLLAKFYFETSAFLLPPDQAFKMIPVGYISFLVLAYLLVWLMRSLCLRGAKDGFLFGLRLGAFVWGALILGLLSISTANPGLLLGWFFGQTAELGIAGAFAGSAFAETKLLRLFAYVFLLIIVCLILTILLQNIGLAPAAKQ